MKHHKHHWEISTRMKSLGADCQYLFCSLIVFHSENIEKIPWQVCLQTFQSKLFHQTDNWSKGKNNNHEDHNDLRNGSPHHLQINPIHWLLRGRTLQYNSNTHRLLLHLKSHQVWHCRQPDIQIKSYQYIEQEYQRNSLYSRSNTR